MEFKEITQSRIEQAPLDRDERARLHCAFAKELEEAGDFDAAQRAVSEWWGGVGVRPETGGLEPLAAGEVLLRAGVLSGWVGSSRQINNAQETAKDLISESAAIFQRLGADEKLAEAQIELAYCYWREGASDEARVILREVLKQLDADDSWLKAVALLRSAIVEASATRFNDALHILTAAAPLFEASANHALKGKFHNELANVLNYLSLSESREDYTDRALVEYTAASFHFEKAGHARNQAAVENNLGYLFTSAGQFNEAHKHLNLARRLFVRLKDSVHTAQVDDTRARTSLAQGRNAEAERIVRQAVHSLERGGEYALLAEALTTHGTALARLGNLTNARAALDRAVGVAETAGNREAAGMAALVLLEELDGNLSLEEKSTYYRLADHLLNHSQHAGTLPRLRKAASRVITAFGADGGTIEVSHAGHDAERSHSWSNFSLKEEVHRVEEHYIRLALEEAHGRVSHAAKLLGFADHGSLNSILKNRHRHLLSARLPKLPRKRSIIRKPRR
jgi:tetratricopeptide (TPR) repeat protein